MLKTSSRKRKDSDKSPLPSWPEDEEKVRNGTCCFDVRYLGSIEVFESSGIQVCEDAAKVLKTQCKGKYKKAVLHVSGDTLRLVDDVLKTLIIDQAIERVAFCSPDRQHEKGFAYICRDGATKRWMCHAFLSVKEPGERLSHAVGCAFNICLEKKQQRDKDNVKVSFNESKTSFTRTGSFRQASISERLADPQSAIIPSSVTVRPSRSIETAAVERPRASASMLMRQSSFKGSGHLADTSMFKRQSSLRVNDLPSTVDRQKQLHGLTTDSSSITISGLNAALPATTSSQTITQMCQQLQSLAALSTDDPFAQITSIPPVAAAPLKCQADYNWESSLENMPYKEPILTTVFQPISSTNTVIHSNIGWVTAAQQPIRSGSRRLSDADQWLEQVSNKLSVAHVSSSNASDFTFGPSLQQSQRTRSRSVDTGEFSVADRSYKMTAFSESRGTHSHNDDYAGISDPFDVSWVKQVAPKSTTGISLCHAGDF